MRESVLVSIITPSYNSSKFIHETIESVRLQTYNNWEMIIVDDASTDGSVNVIESYVKKDSRIKLIQLIKNVGAGEARNKGLENAKGKYIAFLDSDDVWRSDKLDTQVTFMEKYSAAISFTGYSIMDETLTEIKSKINVPYSINLQKYLKTTIIGMSTSMINKNIIGEFRLNSIRSRQDGILWIELLNRGYIAYGLNEQLVSYRMRSNSVSANK